MQKLLISLAVLSLIVPSMASAKLYKCKDENGEVVYTDRECKDGKGEELKLAPFSTYKSNIVPVPIAAKQEPKDPAASYTSFKIIQPKGDELVISFTSNVNVAYKLKGPLLSLKGHKFAISLNGEKLKSRGVTNQIRLDSVNPGTHTLQVFVVDKEDKVIKSSNTVTFHMKTRNTINNLSPGGSNATPAGAVANPGGGGASPGGGGRISGGSR